MCGGEVSLASSSLIAFIARAQIRAGARYERG
jgi:hypothetical protein